MQCFFGCASPLWSQPRASQARPLRPSAPRDHRDHRRPRWQEFFGGAQREYFKRGTGGSAGPAEQRFWRDGPGERRMALMPFVWSVVAGNGQIFGDDSAGSRAGVTNGLWFSYPGYSEMFAGPQTRASTATTRSRIPM